MSDWRLLINSPTNGVTNMARDEALLVAVGEGASLPTMRFYKWDPPTISLGYFQSYSEYESLARSSQSRIRVIESAPTTKAVFVCPDLIMLSTIDSA